MRAAIPVCFAMSEPSSFWARHAALVFALRTFAAAMLALSIALWLDMPRPYSAMPCATLLANVNPTFNWVRLAQRVPVRIALDRTGRSELVAGATATVEVLG
jgi:hypothetical protein